MTTSSLPYKPYDLRKALSDNKLVGLWRMLVDYRLAYTAATIALAISALARTLTFLLLRYFADTVLGSRTYAFGTLNQTLAVIALGFVGLACFEGLFSYLSGRLAAYTAEGITRRTRDYLFDHIQRLSFAYHSKTPTGDLIERVTSDVDSMRRFFSEQAIGVGRIALIFIINFAALLSLHQRLAWISIIAIPVVLGVSLWFFKIVTKRYEKYQEQEAILSTTLQENLTGVRVVKAFARQEYEREKFDGNNIEKFRRGRRLLQMHSLFWPLSDIVLGFQMLAGFVYGATLAINGDITMGTYLAYSGLIVQLIWPIRNLGRIIVQASTGLVSYGRLMEIVKQDRETLLEGRIQPQGPARGDLVFKNVSFMYSDGKSDVLKDISFHVKSGQAVALLGSTGSGKTTLMNLLPRFHEYTGGSILLDGEELSDYPRGAANPNIHHPPSDPLCQASCRESEYPRELVYSLLGFASSPQPTQSGFVSARDFASFRSAQPTNLAKSSRHNASSSLFPPRRMLFFRDD